MNVTPLLNMQHSVVSNKAYCTIDSPGVVSA